MWIIIKWPLHFPGNKLGIDSHLICWYIKYFPVLTYQYTHWYLLFDVFTPQPLYLDGKSLLCPMNTHLLRHNDAEYQYMNLSCPISILTCVRTPGCHTNSPGTSVQRYEPSNILLSVWSPNWTFMKCGAELRPKWQGVALNTCTIFHTIYISHTIFTHLPVNNAKCSTTDVFPEPTGPWRHTALPDTTAKAKLFKFPSVEFTGIRQPLMSCKISKHFYSLLPNYTQHLFLYKKS